MPETSFNPERLGLHYFADDLHYDTQAIQAWLPLLKSSGATWVTLRAPSGRAIPEEFMRTLADFGIEPIIHIPLSLESPPSVEEIAPVLRAYAQWGAKFVAFFDRPNSRERWPDIGWTQRGLVERFLELFLPLAHSALENGLTPVFPPLEPGGDYWDTAFLRAALEELAVRGEDLLLDHLALSAYAWADSKPLDWGAGGPERWPATMPYSTPEGSQDQRGFRIFDWYNTIARASVGEELPILILAAGVDAQSKSAEADVAEHAQVVVEMARQMAAEAPEGEPTDEGIPANVLCCNFWLLADDETSTAFYNTEGKELELSAQWMAWKKDGEPPTPISLKGMDEIFEAEEYTVEEDIFVRPAMTVASALQPILHYLLLPSYEWGASEWHLDAIRPFVLKHRPTVGYSLNEARRSAMVTVVGGEQSFPMDMIEDLKEAGCQVQQLQGDGPEIAAQLASL